jgi:hypothetical protein
MTRNSNLPMLLAVAVATVLGLFAGMPLILRKNGIGLLVVLLVPVLAIAGMALTNRLMQTPNADGAKSKTAYRRKTLMAYGLASILIGPILTLGGGIVVNWINPMHPLDFAPSMLSLSIVGGFAGCTVGIVLAIAAFAWPE